MKESRRWPRRIAAIAIFIALLLTETSCGAGRRSTVEPQHTTECQRKLAGLQQQLHACEGSEVNLLQQLQLYHHPTRAAAATAATPAEGTSSTLATNTTTVAAEGNNSSDAALLDEMAELRALLARQAQLVRQQNDTIQVLLSSLHRCRVNCARDADDHVCRAVDENNSHGGCNLSLIHI